MKKLILLLFVVLNYISAVSQVDSLIYGISALKQGSGLYLSTMNMSSGAIAKITDLPVDQVPGGNGRTIDPLHHLFYYASGTDLLAFDLSTGDLISKIPVTNYLNSTFCGINFNFRDSTLYGLAVDAAGTYIKLAKLDTYSGWVTPVSDSSLATSCSLLPGNALDSDHGIYYFQTIKNPANHLIGVDLHSGNLVSDILIGLDSASRFGPMEYNCHDSTLYGLAGSYSRGRKLATINPHNGVVTTLSRYPVADTLLNEQATIDPFRGIFYFEAIDHSVRGVNITSGDLVSVTYITPLPDSYFTGFLYNHTCYLHTTSSTDEKTYNSALTIFPNPVVDRLTIRSPKPLFNMEILDFTGRTVYRERCEGSKEIQADLTGFPDGLYVVSVVTNSTRVSSKIVKISHGFPLEN